MSPRRWGALRTIGVVIAMVAALSVLAWQVQSRSGTGGQSQARTTCDVSQASIEASSTAPDGTDASGRDIDYSAQNLLDADENTAWRTPGKGIGATITLYFAQPCDLTSVQLLNGYNKVDPDAGTDRWKQNRRVAKLAIRTDGTSRTSNLDPGSRDWQVLTLIGSGVQSLTLEILSSAPSKAARDYTALSEIRVA